MRQVGAHRASSRCQDQFAARLGRVCRWSLPSISRVCGVALSRRERRLAAGLGRIGCRSLLWTCRVSFAVLCWAACHDSQRLHQASSRWERAGSAPGGRRRQGAAIAAAAGAGEGATSVRLSRCRCSRRMRGADVGWRPPKGSPPASAAAEPHPRDLWPGRAEPWVPLLSSRASPRTTPSE